MVKPDPDSRRSRRLAHVSCTLIPPLPLRPQGANGPSQLQPSLTMVDDPETIMPKDDGEVKSPARPSPESSLSPPRIRPPPRLRSPPRPSLKRSSSPLPIRPEKVSRQRTVKQEHDVIYISSDSEPEEDIKIPEPSNNALQRVPNLAPRPDTQVSGISSPSKDKEDFRQALLLEDCLLLSSLDLDTDMADDAVVPRHSFNGRIRTVVQDLRKARIAEWQAVRDSSRIREARQSVDAQRNRLASMVVRRVDGMIKDHRQPGLHSDDWNRLQQYFPHVGQLRTSRPAIAGPSIHVAGVMGLEPVGPTPSSASTTTGVILPHALFPGGRYLPAEAWQTMSVSKRLLPIEPGRVRLLVSMTPLPVPLAANRGAIEGSSRGVRHIDGASRVEELKEEEGEIKYEI